MRVSGIVRVPGDKSLSHRALILAALADGTSRIGGILDSADVRSTADVLRALGVQVPELSTDMTVLGRGLRGLQPPSADLDCGNSGTTARLLSGVVAACPFAARFIGDSSLSRRPMRRVARPLEAMGARFGLAEHGGLPMAVHGGSLRTIDWTSETASAQVKSAILLAGLVAGVPVTIREPSRSRDHTERMLASLDVAVTAISTIVHLEPPTRMPPLDLSVPGDPSSAAFLVALATLADEGELVIADVCLNPTRTGFFHVLHRMAGMVTGQAEGLQGGEPVGTVRARPAKLRAVDVTANDVPSMIDELPLLACVAARAEGTTTVRGAGELRVKESDRIAAVVGNLRAVGVDARELPDGMVITGSDAPLRGRVRTFGDHRVAMAFGVLGAATGREIAIDDPACVAVSYPAFWSDLARVTGA